MIHGNKTFFQLLREAKAAASVDYITPRAGNVAKEAAHHKAFRTYLDNHVYNGKEVEHHGKRFTPAKNPKDLQPGEYSFNNPSEAGEHDGWIRGFGEDSVAVPLNLKHWMDPKQRKKANFEVSREFSTKSPNERHKQIASKMADTIYSIANDADPETIKQVEEDPTHKSKHKGKRSRILSIARSQSPKIKDALSSSNIHSNVIGRMKSTEGGMTEEELQKLGTDQISFVGNKHSGLGIISSSHAESPHARTLEHMGLEATHHYESPNNQPKITKTSRGTGQRSYEDRFLSVQDELTSGNIPRVLHNGEDLSWHEWYDRRYKNPTSNRNPDKELKKLADTPHNERKAVWVKDVIKHAGRKVKPAAITLSATRSINLDPKSSRIEAQNHKGNATLASHFE